MNTENHGNIWNTRVRGRVFARAAWALSALGVLLALAPEARAAAESCRDSLLPVALAPGQRADQQVFTRLCLPEGQPPATVQLLVHGITYSHLYWDFPDPTAHTERYSYVRSALNAGFATLAMDRIGNGVSSHPLGTSVTIDTNAYVVHQVIQALRSGQLEGPSGPVAFQKVLLVGHSYGSFTAWYEVTDYQDVDGVILSGVSHTIGVDSAVRAFGTLQPAASDPAFAGLGYDPTYETTRPGTRYYAFYDPGQADPAVLALDEQTKGTVVLSETDTFALILARPLDLRVPVLLVNGTQDRLFCGPTLTGTVCSSAALLRAVEQPRLGPQVPCVDAFVLPGAGHDLNTLYASQDWFAVAQDWAARRVGTGAGAAPGCGP